MLKKFQKQKYTIIISVVLSGFLWANFSLAQFLHDYDSGIPVVSRTQVITSVLSWIFIFMFLLGIIGICVSGILFFIDYFKKRKMNKMNDRSQG